MLDGATSALANDTEAEIMESIDGLHGQKTLIIIAHRLTTIANCGVDYWIEDGKLVKKKDEHDNRGNHRSSGRIE